MLSLIDIDIDIDFLILILIQEELNIMNHAAWIMNDRFIDIFIF